MFKIALKKFHASKFKSSISVLDDIKEEMPEMAQVPEFLFLRAMNYYMLEDWENAVKAWQGFLSRPALLADYGLYYLSDSLMHKEDYYLAMETLSHLLSNYPKSRFVYNAQIRQAEALVYMGNIEEGLARFERLYNGIPIDMFPHLKLSLGKAYEFLGRWQDAMDIYADIYVRFPAFPEADTARESMESLLKEHRGSIADPLLTRRLERIQNLVNLSEFSRALGESEEIELSVLSPGAQESYYYLRALSQYSLRQYSTALRTIDSGYAKGFRNADIVFLRGKALSRMGKYDEAKKEYKTIITDYRDSQWVDNAYFKLATLSIFDGDYVNALRNIDYLIENFPQSDAIVDALWAKAWYSYNASLKEDCLSALERLSGMDKISMIERSRAKYWLARIKEENEKEAAWKIYQELSEATPPNYYTILALWRIKSPYLEKPFLFKPCQSELLPELSGQSFHLERAKALAEIEFRSDSRVEAKLAEAEATGEIAPLLEIGNFYLDWNMFYDAVIMASAYFGADMWRGKNPDCSIGKVAYPRGYKHLVEEYTIKYGVDPNLVYAVIFSESLFKEDSVSRANAMGLMQIMPTTGRYLASISGLTNYSDEMLLDPEINLGLGIKYISMLFRQYSGNLAFMLAHYNAGAGNLNSWFKRWNLQEIDKFVENIPFKETREYIRKVITVYFYYSWLYGGEIDLYRVLIPFSPTSDLPEVSTSP